MQKACCYVYFATGLESDVSRFCATHTAALYVDPIGPRPVRPARFDDVTELPKKGTTTLAKKIETATQAKHIGACMLERSRACAMCARLSQFFLAWVVHMRGRSEGNGEWCQMQRLS